MSRQTGAGVVDEQSISGGAELDVERGERIVVQMDLIDAAVAIDRKHFSPDSLNIDLVAVVSRIDADRILGVDVGKLNVRRTGPVEHGQIALKGSILQRQLVAAAAEADGRPAAHGDRK